MTSLLIYGGSFDPPHLGHLQTAIAVQQRLQFDRFVFVPCKTSVLKQHRPAPAAERIVMLSLLLKNHPEFSIDTREIDRKSPSFMVDTLNSFRDEMGAQVSITLLMGMDTFLTLEQWHQWQTLPNLCHLLVITRDGITAPAPESLITKLSCTPCQSLNDLIRYPKGKIGYFNAGIYAISSTQIRNKIRDRAEKITELPDDVFEYIKRLGLYQ